MTENKHETIITIDTISKGLRSGLICVKNGGRLEQMDGFKETTQDTDNANVHPCCQDCVFRYEDFCARCNESGDPKDLQTIGKTIQRNDSCSHFASEPALSHLFGDAILHNRPEVNAVETIDYNPDSMSGGQFVFTDYAYSDIIQMMANCRDVDSFFVQLDATSKQYCVDKGTQDFRDLVYAFLNEKEMPDFKTNTLRSAYQVMNAAMEGIKMSKYPYIEGTADEEILYQHLSDYALQIINCILEAYASGKIDFIEPRTPDGEPDFEGSYELVKNDSSYFETGCELLVLKWIESHEDTGYLIECMQDIQNKYLVAYIKDDFAQTIIVNADSPKAAEQHILSDPDCFVYKVSPLTVTQYERFKHLREVIAA